MTTNILLSPPMVFAIILIMVLFLSKMLSMLAFKPAKKIADQGKPYACGENIPTHMIQPDYTQFFPFAFYFTILHVVALMVALVPIETLETLSIAVIYVLVAVVGLMVLYRR
jgi:NADH:ubiquinone oxidoreductase subunit 3 (subunit A)